MRRSLARTLADLGRFSEAEAELHDLMATINAAGAEDEIASVLEILGDVCARQGRYGEAEERYLRAIAILAREEPESPWVGLATIGLARIYRDAGRTEAAEAAYLRGLELMENGWGASDPDFQKAAAELEELGKASSSS